jgi:hypothetical protein
MIHVCHKAPVEMIGPNLAVSSWEPEPTITPPIIG